MNWDIIIMTNMNDIFFELIRLSIGTNNSLSHIPSETEWAAMYNMAKKQSLVGICFAGVQKLCDSDTQDYCGMSEIQYLTWMGMAAKIQQRNIRMNEYTAKALAFFREKGFPCQVLKGQGIAKLYKVKNVKEGKERIESDLSLLRQSGDIDVWLAGGREKIYKLSLDTFGEITGANYHHIHFPIWKEPEIEAHIYPSYLSSPLRNKRLQDFCKQYEPLDDSDDTPSLAFNRVFILLHCYRHLSGHGVGMRQLMDYYFVLKTLSDSPSPLLASPPSPYCGQRLPKAGEEKEETMKWVERLGMKRFAHATMWFMKEVFGLEDEYLICEPNEKDGLFLLSEVLQTGNMGHSDERVDKSKLNSSLGRYIYNFKRDIHVMRICPHEALWEPWFSLVLFIRRKFVWSRKWNVK